MAKKTGDFREGAKISVLYSKTQETVFANVISKVYSI
jgi:hypothetical protein